MYLNEAQEGQKNAQDELQETRLENLDISKEYAKPVEDSYSILQVSLRMH